MRPNYLEATLKTAVLAVTILLLAAGVSFAQTINLTAAPAFTTVPDGQQVPMWGYACGAVDPSANGATCAALNTGATTPTNNWSPVLITVPAVSGTGATLTINLTNGLPAPVPTSLTIVGTVGGGLGSNTNLAPPSPAHAVQGATWPIAGDSSGAVYNPPPQGPRVQSFGTEVANAATVSGLTWSGLKPGTYLIESGTHPSIQGPMGLYGVLVVTTAPVTGTPGTAYTGVNYDADAVALLSEIDAVQNRAVAAAVATTGFSETAAIVLRDTVSAVTPALDASGNPIAGTGYSAGDIVTISGGGYSVQATAQVATVDTTTGAILTVTVTNPGKGYTSVPTSVTVTSAGSGAQLVAALSLAGTMCSGGAAACYPPAVNYDPRYYLVNGKAFDTTNPGNSVLSVTGLTATSTNGVLVRFVNAGVRMHVPSVVGLNMSLIAEDANVLPGVRRVQNEVFLAAGKVHDVIVNPATDSTGTPVATAYGVFDRQLSLSTNNQHDGGMQAYLQVNGGALPAPVTATANPDSYFLQAGKTLTVSDVGKGVIANDVNIYGVTVNPTALPNATSTLVLNGNGTFTYTPGAGVTSDTFGYCGNNATSGSACTTVTLAACTAGDGCLGGPPAAADDAYTSNVASRLQITPPGVLANDIDPKGHPLTVDTATIAPSSGLSVTVNADGSFTATTSGPGTATCALGVPTGTQCYTFTYQAKNSQGTNSNTATATLTFLPASNITVNVWDAPSMLPGKTPVPITDYRWILEEDRTFVIDPNTPVRNTSFGTNFHTSYMPVVAAGCVGTVACESGQTLVDPSSGAHNPAVCDIGNGSCRTNAGLPIQQTPLNPNQVYLDPAKRYYITIFPGDAGNPFSAGAGAPVALGGGKSRPFNIALDCPSGPGGADFAPGTGTCGHGIGGGPIGLAQTTVNITLEETPFPTASIAVFVFEDDSPLNGENDSHGGTDLFGTAKEPGLGGFEITLFDDAGGTGDATGQMTYDMFNMPLSNSLAGTVDQLTGLDACPISKNPDRLIGMIVTCPTYESDGKTVSPLVGQAVIANMMPGRYGVVATPGADRRARGEEWLQTNTLDGQKAHDAFIKIGGPAYFQEFGPAGYHDSIGFANPKIINNRLPGFCANLATLTPPQVCNNTLTGKVTTARMSRTPDQRLYSSGSRDSLGFTQCYVSFGDPDDDDLAFTKCNPDGTFTLSGLPPGDWRVTIFDQWNDQIVDGLSTPVRLGGGNTVNMHDIPVQQWHTNIYTRSYLDQNFDGVSNVDTNGNPTEPGLTLLPTNIRFRDGSYSNFNNTDLSGFAGFNEEFPLFNWYVLETDTTRYKQTGVHVVYDAGGPADGTLGGGTSNIGNFLADTIETNPLPTNLRVPGAVYCGDADCSTDTRLTLPNGGGPGGSTGRIDPPWVQTEAWQGFIGQNEFVEFGKAPFAQGENGGIHGEVIYASTRPFDDPSLLIHTSWTPDVPGVTINLYQEGTAADGTTTLTLVDTTKTTSWDDWAQGFRGGTPNALSSITVTNPGSGYSPIQTITVTNPGSGYTSAPKVTIVGGGSGATATATLVGSGISITLTNPGAGYTNPAVIIGPPPTGGTQATATATALAPPAVTIAGCTGATATALVGAGGVVTFIQITNEGSTCSSPAVGIGLPPTGGTQATAAATTGSTVPNMNCPGQDPTSLFFFTLENSRQWLNQGTLLPNSSQFKCYDGFSMFNQVQPAPYDGYYTFPSVTSRDLNGKPLTTNCLPTVCTPNHATSTTDWYYGTPMLPDGKYVVEMIVPPGYELVKEEDKNILIGDNYIAPVTQQFGGLGSIFILPDQAEIGSAYNPNNPQNATQTLGRPNYPQHEGDTGSVETFWPCVGAQRIVPDYISLFPLSKEVSPFAGATRNLCDRKEVNLEDQTSVLAKFWIFSSAHVAAHYTGIVLDDFSSEFDPFSPQYGEKFAVPNVPISFKDHNGVEVSRTYSDQWGLFDGLQYSTWEVNPPNPTGYAPTMMVTCMNDPGPIPDPANPGQTMTDPLYNPAYSQFCYEIPFMPGQTQYMDTPVVPTEAFADGYNLPDCAYPDATPAIKSVTGDAIPGGGAGPWVSSVGNTHRLTITALGDQVVPNNAYSGPAATTAPYNQKFITRHYNFGTCTPSGATSGPCTVTITNPNGNPVSLGGISWSPTSITGFVPSGVCPPGNCPANYGGQLVITGANGQQSIDTVTVNVGGSTPKYVSGENATNNAIQQALDTATPGDLIIVAPGTYNEMLIMWKPVRLQGVGAASVTVNANTHPSGKMDAWRRKIDCLFSLSLNGGYISATNPFDPTGANSCQFVDTATGNGIPQVDPIPLEPIQGWDPTLNGNIAELLQEPTLMGAYEGAAITVLAKGVQSALVNGDRVYDPNCVANGICVPLTNSAADCSNYPSNFLCHPSRVDGLTFVNSSQGGGGIFLHGWNHFTEVSNNRVHSNAGTFSGGITVGQAETPDAAILPNGQAAAFGYNTNVKVHNNSITQNASYGDELNSTTPEAAGGITFCTGADNYKFNHNWVCGNLSAGDGGGFAHFGLSYNGNISNNWFLFNQSTNPTIPTHGGGVLVMGAAPDGPVCENNTIDIDCPPTLSDGAGPGLVIDSNLILGNTAESGSGGGLRLQNINGTEVAPNATTPGNFFQVTVTNNIIVDNVAGWDGGGVSMQDALNVNFINNTVMSNDTTASSGVLFNTLGAPNANTPPPGCDPTVDPSCAGNQVTDSSFQPAGLVVMPNTPNLIKSFPAGGITCPPGHSSPSQPNACALVSYPSLENNVIWQNRSFHIDVGTFGSGVMNQQHLVTLNPELSQTATGSCVSGAHYWEIGVRGDQMDPNTFGLGHQSGFTLNPIYSILTDAADYPGANNLGFNPNVASQYCNGSRVPPENGGLGYNVPPGISDATLPNPVFNLTPAATVDEGNNWINMTYGPLSLSNPTQTATLGNYAITNTSPAINNATAGNATNGFAPNHDFFGTTRPQGPRPDIGAVEFPGGTGAAVLSLSPTSIAFGNHLVGTSTTLSATLTNLGGGTANITYSGLGFLSPFSRNTGGANCGATLADGASCTISITFAPSRLQLTNTQAYSATLTLTFTAPATPGSLSLGLTGTGFQLFSPLLLAFGNQQVGTPSAPQSVTLNNQGLTPITITAVGLSSSQFTGLNFSSCGAVLPITLNAGATCTVSVQFRPTTTGGKLGLLNITVAGQTLPFSALLTGTGIQASVSFSLQSPWPLTTAIANTNLKGPGTVTVTNNGTANLVISATAVTGTGFSKTTGAGALDTCTGATLGSAASCRVNVSYNPGGSTVTRTGTLTITDTGAATPTQSTTFPGN